MDYEERLSRLKPLLYEVLELLGEDPEREGLHKTPERWAKALLTYTSGTRQNIDDHLNVFFTLDEDDWPAVSDDMVMVNNIHFVSTCEHHIAPFRGVVHIGYIPHPGNRIITGLSKLARVVKAFSQRLQLQERMTQQISSAIDEALNPLGVITVVQAIHYCMIQRGVEQHSAMTVTTARRGVFLENSHLEFKFLEYLQMSKDKNFERFS